MLRVALGLLALLAMFGGGCSSLRSRYAMDDPVYAEKYADGADKGDLVGKAKQALDARHTAGMSGLYVSGGTQVRPESSHVLAGAELGVEHYLASWATARGSLAGYVGEEDAFGGVDLGFRLQAPTRVAPFVGVGMFHGYSENEVVADRDGIDNNSNGYIDEYKEKKTEYDGFLSAVYPELGMHWWINGQWRVTAFGRYLVTTEGRDQDDWLLGLQVTAFGR